MARIITKELAKKIAKKLGAEIAREGAHDVARVFHEGRLVAQFGIRRAAKKDIGHDHLSRDLHIGPHKARLLGQCPLSREQWINILREQGLIGPSSAQAANENGGGE